VRRAPYQPLKVTKLESDYFFPHWDEEGSVRGDYFFVSRDDERGGFDSAEIERHIKDALGL